MSIAEPFSAMLIDTCLYEAVAVVGGTGSRLPLDMAMCAFDPGPEVARAGIAGGFVDRARPVAVAHALLERSAARLGRATQSDSSRKRVLSARECRSCAGTSRRRRQWLCLGKGRKDRHHRWLVR
jgi:hypothetical protein